MFPGLVSVPVKSKELYVNQWQSLVLGFISL